MREKKLDQVLLDSTDDETPFVIEKRITDIPLWLCWVILILVVANGATMIKIISLSPGNSDLLQDVFMAFMIIVFGCAALTVTFSLILGGVRWLIGVAKSVI